MDPLRGPFSISKVNKNPVLYASAGVHSATEMELERSANEEGMTQRHQNSVATVNCNQKKYTKRQNRDAEQVRELVASLGLPPLAIAVQQVRPMRNCPIAEP